MSGAPIVSEARIGAGAPISWAVALGLAVVVLWISLALLPYDSDGAFAVSDPMWYALQVEESPARAISGHHPLFHILLIAWMYPLRALDVAGASHVACRIVAGLGGAWLLIQICALAGRGRLWVGLAFALAVLSTRGFIVEAASGENVLPAAAAALFAITLAARHNPDLVKTGAALGLALALRQDNVFLVPGIVVALASGLPSGERVRKVSWFLLGAGLATAAVYGIAWAIHGATPLVEWLTHLGRHGPWTGPRQFEIARFATYATSISLAMTGRIAAESYFDPWIGPAYVGAIVLAGFLLRGTAPNARLVVPVVLTLIGRAFFHTWYEADNPEWLVLPIAFVAACASGLACGEPATRVPWRIAGIGTLAALTAWFFIAHGPYTWRLRERRLMASIEQAAAVDRSRWRFVGLDGNVNAGLTLLGIPHAVVPFRVDEMLPAIANEIRSHPVPTIVIGDRYVKNGMPVDYQGDLRFALDAMEDPPGWKLIRRDGLVIGAQWTPPASVGSAESR